MRVHGAMTYPRSRLVSGAFTRCEPTGRAKRANTRTFVDPQRLDNVSAMREIMVDWMMPRHQKGTGDEGSYRRLLVPFLPTLS